MKPVSVSPGRISAIGLLTVLGLSPLLPAQDEQPPSRVNEAIARRREQVQTFAEKKGITNNWWGAGSWLRERGIRFEAAATFFAQGPVAGEHGAGADFGGKLDSLLRLDLHKLGLFYYSFADYLQDPEFVTVPLEDECGMELFYNATVTPWMRMTGDLQIIGPGVPSQDLAVLLGLRATVRF